MPLWLNWLLAVLVIVALIVIFVVSFVLYRKTPVPKGCEDLERNEEKCAACSETGCRFNLYYGKSEEEKKESLFKAEEVTRTDKETSASQEEKTEETGEDPGQKEEEDVNS